MPTAAKMKPIPGKTVLIVDDSAPIRAQLRYLFLSDSFTICAEAANGREAIAAAKNCKPNLIILDLSMPVMNGLEAAPELRKLLPDVPIILYTLYAGAFPDSEFQRRGITAVVAKNDPVEALLQTAKGLLQSTPGKHSSFVDYYACATFSLSSGSVTNTVVPFALDSIVKVPPAANTRSRMPRNPTPEVFPEAIIL